MIKSVTKRIKITGRGKMARRQMAQDHFKARHPGSYVRDKRRATQVANVDVKSFRDYRSRN